MSLDPLAADFPEWSDYNYVLGNPVMLIDPDGKAPEGDFYGVFQGEVRYIGNDGQDDGKQYLVKDLSAFGKKRNEGLDGKSTKDLIRSKSILEITANIPSNSLTTLSSPTEGDFYSYLTTNMSMSNYSSDMNENGVQIYLNLDDATLNFHTPKNTQITQLGLPERGLGHVGFNTPNEIKNMVGNKNIILLGNVHTHPTVEYTNPVENIMKQSKLDGKNSRNRGITTYSLDREGYIFKHHPRGSNNSEILGVSVQGVVNGNFSLAKDMLKTTAY